MSYRDLRFFLGLSLLAASAGCALPPKSAPWRNDQEMIVAQPPDALGYLTVETQDFGSPEEGEQPHEKFYLYDQSGRYLSHFPNNNFSPIGLAPGRYVVVSRVSGQNKRVQVEIKDGFTAYIRLADLKAAPSAD